MIEKIKEQNVWDFLKYDGRPIILYGMGNGADMVIEKLTEIGLDFQAVFASDEFVRGQSFHGKVVEKYSDVSKKYSDFIIVMCFAVHDEATLNKVRKLSGNHTLVAPNVPIVNDGIFTREYIEEHNDEFDKAYSLLSDEFSRKSYINVLNFKVSGKVEYLFSCEKKKNEIYEEYLHLGDEEIFMDLGAYDGDTIREFLNATNNNYKKIYAVEADEKNYNKLTKYCNSIDNYECYNLAAWDKKDTLLFEKKKGRNSKLGTSGTTEILADSVDNILSGKCVTFLKMDIEGSEEKALNGAKETIKMYRPKLYVCAYHRNSDMFRLPIKIHDLCEKYKIYFCHNPYIPAWESNFYCIIEE